jgi:16S rRNA G527 N7-methylase RsmG
MSEHTQFSALADALLRTAGPLGLTGYGSRSALLSEAIEPALALHELLQGAPIGEWLEIGPGSGACGLGLAIASPTAHFTLADRRARVVAHLDLAIRRLGLPNADAVCADVATLPARRPWSGVIFRALAEPDTAMRLAAQHSKRWICAWHSPAAAYDSPPAPFRISARVRTCAHRLVATLYERG